MMYHQKYQLTFDYFYIRRVGSNGIVLNTEFIYRFSSPCIDFTSKLYTYSITMLTRMCRHSSSSPRIRYIYYTVSAQFLFLSSIYGSFGYGLISHYIHTRTRNNELPRATVSQEKRLLYLIHDVAQKNDRVAYLRKLQRHFKGN